MKTVQQEWEDYSSNVYPDGMFADQAQQLKDTFFAAYLVALANLMEMADKLPEEQVVLKIEERRKEAYDYCQRRIKEMKQERG